MNYGNSMFTFGGLVKDFRVQCSARGTYVGLVTLAAYTTVNVDGKFVELCSQIEVRVLGALREALERSHSQGILLNSGAFVTGFLVHNTWMNANGEKCSSLIAQAEQFKQAFYFETTTQTGKTVADNGINSVVVPRANLVHAPKRIKSTLVTSTVAWSEGPTSVYAKLNCHNHVADKAMQLGKGDGVSIIGRLVTDVFDVNGRRVSQLKIEPCELVSAKVLLGPILPNAHRILKLPAVSSQTSIANAAD